MPGDDLSSDWRQGTLAGNGTACFFDHLLGHVRPKFLAEKKLEGCFIIFIFIQALPGLSGHVHVSAYFVRCR